MTRRFPFFCVQTLHPTHDPSQHRQPTQRQPTAMTTPTTSTRLTARFRAPTSGCVFFLNFLNFSLPLKILNAHFLLELPR